MLDVVVLISGSGGLLKFLLEQAQTPGFPARVVAVGSDTDAPGLAHARDQGIPTFVVRPKDFPDREGWGSALLEEIRRFGVGTIENPGLVVSAGLMRILPEPFVRALSPHLINTHPALLPNFPGAHAVRDALAAGAEVTGTTIHIIDAGVDTGPIISQREVAVLTGDTEDALQERIKRVERPLLAETVKRIANQEIRLDEISSNSKEK